MVLSRDRVTITITAAAVELAELQRALEEPELRILALHKVSTSLVLGCVKLRGMPCCVAVLEAPLECWE